MRPILVGIILAAYTTPALADHERYTSDDGKFAADFPGAPKVTAKTTPSAVGNLQVHVATYANSDGSTFMVSYTDFPDPATKPDNLGTLFDGIRDGVKGRDGKVVGEEKTIKFGPNKLPGREFTVEKDKGKQRIRYRVVVRDRRVYQVAVIGSQDFTSGNDATAFLATFELTK
ncbi:hypothetical protein [Frigoriglobus tundricola]|uniref:PsbP C-terminal domain-containing protein n=1 Tax=Frigoriglobus tundricola TaxID=2774151 RepID=A0A6M5YRS3_9BACT|nr:hypothetical protein [Frigoriglobus tundricola]QJW96130.1 hypothetical protein FTUN_3685 [Frigoriglobus tundricola]